MSLLDAAYKGAVLDIDRAFYTRLAELTDGRDLVEKFVIPIRSGKAWRVRGGDICRIVAIEGPQVGDFNVWNGHNPRERMWASRTRQLQRAHVSTFDRIWSNLPYMRPLLTFTNDTLADYGCDAEGGRVHDLLGTRCDPYINKILSGVEFDFHCHSNLVRALLPFGLTESDVHDVLNVFQCTGLNEQDQYFMKTCPARQGDFLEFFAEVDLLCAMSTCPGGDLSIPMWGDGARDPVEVCRPLQVEVYRPAPELLTDWSPPQAADYRGNHGMSMPTWGATDKQ
jgi:uncharacterized protein